MSLNGPVAEAIGWALLHLLWQGVVVAAILAAVLALLAHRSANARYVASCGALALLLVLGIATAWRSYQPGSQLTVGSRPERTAATVNSQLPAVHNIAPAAISFATRLRASLPIIVLAWLVGVALLSSRLLMTWLRAHRLAHTAMQSASDEWHRIVGRLADAMQLRRAVRIVESAAVEVPAVIGWLRPMILLPAATITGLAPRQIEMVLAHELAHIRRNDFFVNLLQAVVETLMFYHPAVWWMSHRVRVERENCCDDLAVAVCGDALQYARALTRLEELRTPSVAMAANGGSLLARVRRIAGARAESIGSRWTAAIAMLSIVAILIAIPSLPALAQRDQAKPAPEAKARKAETVVTVQESNDESGDAEATDDETPVAAIAPVAPGTPAQPRTPAPFALGMAPTPMPRLAAMPDPLVFALAPEAPRVPGTPMALAGEMVERHRNDRRLDAAGKLTVDELVALRAAGVTPEFMTTMRRLFPELTIGELAGLGASGVTTEWIEQMKRAGVQIRSAEDAIRLHAAGVDETYIREMERSRSNR